MDNERLVRLNWPPRNDGSRGLSERQREFLNCAARYQLYGGSKRGGKTVAGCAKAIYLSVLYPGNRGMIARAFHTDLVKSTLDTFFRICPPELIKKHNSTEHKIILRAAGVGVTSEIIYQALDEDSEGAALKSKEKLKGIDLGWLWVDEPSEVSSIAVDMLDAQMCWTLPDGKRPPYMLMLTSNPEPGWVKDRYVDVIHPDYIIGKADARFIPSLPSDNPGLPPGWESDLRATRDPEWVKRYLDGSWDIAEGGVFPYLSTALHDLDNFVTADRWYDFAHSLQLVAGMDYGSTGVTAYVLCGIDAGNNLYALQEWYGRDMLISQHAEGIRAIERSYGRTPQYRVIDPSTDSGTMQGRNEMYSVRAAFQEPRYGHVSPESAIFTEPAFRHEISVGLDRINEMLHVSGARRHPFTGTYSSPSMFISKSRCPNLWREMAGLKKVVTTAGKLDFKGEDHACDCLRYVSMSRPEFRHPTPEELAEKRFKELQAQEYERVGLVGLGFNHKAHADFLAWQKRFTGRDMEGKWF